MSNKTFINYFKNTNNTNLYLLFENIQPKLTIFGIIGIILYFLLIIIILSMILSCLSYKSSYYYKNKKNILIENLI